METSAAVRHRYLSIDFNSNFPGAESSKSAQALGFQPIGIHFEYLYYMYKYIKLSFSVFPSVTNAESLGWSIRGVHCPYCRFDLFLIFVTINQCYDFLWLAP